MATEASGMLAIVEGGVRFHMPESIADLEIDSGLVVGQPPQVLPIRVAFLLEVWKGPKFCVGARLFNWCSKP
eukprot:111149-Pelagomonas_calceolata.AAC.1